MERDVSGSVGGQGGEGERERATLGVARSSSRSARGNIRVKPSRRLRLRVRHPWQRRPPPGGGGRASTELPRPALPEGGAPLLLSFAPLLPPAPPGWLVSGCAAMSTPFLDGQRRFR